MSTLHEEITDAINKGWVIFDLKCKPVGESWVTLYDKNKNMYYNPGHGWTHKPVVGSIKNIEPWKKNWIRMIMVSDIRGQRDGDIYFFGSTLKHDEESWSMVALYSFREEKTNPLRKTSAFVIDEEKVSMSSIEDIIRVLSHVSGVKVPIEIASANSDAFPKLTSDIANLFLTGSEQHLKMKHLNPLQNKGMLKKWLREGELMDSTKKIEAFLDVIEHWNNSTSFMITAGWLSDKKLWYAMKDLVDCGGVVIMNDGQELTYESTCEELPSKTLDSFFIDLSQDVRDELSLVNLIRVCRLLGRYKNDKSAVSIVINRFAKGNINANTEKFCDLIDEGKDLRDALDFFIGKIKNGKIDI